MIKILVSVVCCLILFTIKSNSSVKDSVEKYKSTKYIGNIFKNYEYLPEPINQKHKFSMLNILNVVGENNKPVVCYEPGMQYIYRTPQWQDGKSYWVRGEYGVYVKGLLYKNFVFSYGLSLNLRMGEKFYLGYNIGFLLGTFEESFTEIEEVIIITEFGPEVEFIFHDYYKNIKGYGFEYELKLGYDFNVSDWIFSPELKLNFNLMKSKDNHYSDFIKSPIQIGLNIGRLY